MITEAVSAGYYHSDGWGQDYPRIQILTIDDLLHGRAQLKMPPQFGTFKQAQKVQLKAAEQRELGFGQGIRGRRFLRVYIARQVRPDSKGGYCSWAYV